MTGPERVELQALREDMREGFRDLGARLDKGLDGLGGRVDSLESTRDQHRGGWEADQRSAVRITAERRWRIGLLIGVGGSLAAGVLNLLRTM